MNFFSMLYPASNGGTVQETMPEFFSDLNLDQVIDAILLEKQEYGLRPIYYTPLTDPETVYFRQQIMQELEKPSLLALVKSFAEKMKSVRAHLVEMERFYYSSQQKAWFLDAAEMYCEAVQTLSDCLASMTLESQGFLAFRV
ncbi:hypothetical protein, partial [Alicyclobacillus shizuokensis]|uniref:hypothetical protein n=1 Tax=Alicyclobacillus shizuokensis TaxID=392014 RepID=UPI001C3F461E